MLHLCPKMIFELISLLKMKMTIFLFIILFVHINAIPTHIVRTHEEAIKWMRVEIDRQKSVGPTCGKIQGYGNICQNIARLKLDTRVLEPNDRYVLCNTVTEIFGGRTLMTGDGSYLGGPTSCSSARHNWNHAWSFQ